MEGSLADGDGAPPRSSISLVSAVGDKQSFDGPEEFIAAHPPDYLPDFRRLAATASSDRCEVAFELNRQRRMWRSDGEASLWVVAADPSAARGTMAELVPVARAGYQSFWGPCSIPAGLESGSALRRHLHLVRTALNAGVAGVLGAALYLATAQYDVPALALVALLIGLAVPPAIDRVVPDIDIASGGHTRFRAIVNRLSLVALAPLGTWFIGLFTG